MSTLKDALRIVNRREHGLPVPFSLEYISYDSNRSRGKERSTLRRIDNAVKVRSSHDSKRNATITVKKLTGPGVDTIHFKLIMKLNNQAVW